jgi:methylated-DNA-[protein]-cysteine S-methyltransferase
MIYTHFSSKFGPLLACAHHDALRGLYFVGQKYEALVQGSWAEMPNDPLLLELQVQFKAYEKSGVVNFDLPMDPQGTVFQKGVWSTLLAIEPGKTWTYSEVAEKAASKAAVRAVGSAIGKNPLSVIIPCHRVIGSNGALTGYAGGLARKAALLEHEGVRLIDSSHGADLFA